MGHCCAQAAVDHTATQVAARTTSHRDRPEAHRPSTRRATAEPPHSPYILSPLFVKITNAAAAHLEEFGSLDDVIDGKGEQFYGIEGTTIVPNWQHAGFWLRRV